MNDDAHIGDDAALYALGALERPEIERIDAHVAHCDPCAAQLGEAEAALATLAEAELAGERNDAVVLATRRRSTRSAWTRWSAGLAAAFALATAGLTARDVTLSRTVRNDDRLLLAMVRSHFAHVQFAAQNHAPLPVKLVYERHGRWYEVLSADPRATTVVAVNAGGEATRETIPAAHDNGIAALRLSVHGRLEHVALLDPKGTEIASVHPAVAESDAP